METQMGGPDDQMKSVLPVNNGSASHAEFAMQNAMLVLYQLAKARVKRSYGF